METIEIRNELWIKREDLIQAQGATEMDTPEWRIIHVELNWFDEMLNKIYCSCPELRPKATKAASCS